MLFVDETTAKLFVVTSVLYSIYGDILDRTSIVAEFLEMKKF